MSGYAHVFIRLSVVVVTLPSLPVHDLTDREFICRLTVWFGNYFRYSVGHGIAASQPSGLMQYAFICGISLLRHAI